jgi:hypothetical protein
MANTRIQVKRSSSAVGPGAGALDPGEIAYSFISNTFFIGTPGATIDPIGGKYFTERTNSAYIIAVAAFDSANAASGGSISAVYDKANSANYYAYLVDANTSAAFAKANAASIAAGAAFGNANSKFSSSGGTINGDVNITGNLSVTGNTTFINVASYVVNDPLLYIAGNNYISDIVDIGFVANYVNATGSNVHTGFFRDAGSKEYYVFQEYNQEPYNNVIDPTANGFTISVLNATLRTSNIILGGINALSWITNAYNTANNVGGAVTTANNIAVAAFAAENVTRAIAIAAFAQANTGGGGGGSSNASNITSGTLLVAYGGTGTGTFTTNGILYGNTTGALKVTAAGTDGQLLQVLGSTGVPGFAMLDGGAF